MSNVPNLDAMTVDELRQFCFKHLHGRKHKELFPKGGQGVITMTNDLSSYAMNKLTAMTLRASGHVRRALEYETICEGIYEYLPEEARW